MLFKLTAHGLRLRTIQSRGVFTQFINDFTGVRIIENAQTSKVLRFTKPMLQCSIRSKSDWSIKQRASTSAAAAAAVEKILVVRCNHEEGMLEVTWNEQKPEKFPYVWLRDNCPCERCTHPTSHARTFFLKDLDLSVRPMDTDVDYANKKVTVNWSDGHRSEFDLDWLEERRFNPENQRRHLEDTTRTQTYKTDRKNIKSLKFDDVLNEDESLYDWITEMEMNGICLLTGATSKHNQIDTLSQRVAFMRKTAIGTCQVVKAVKSPTNPTYTSEYLPLHTDHPYYFNIPGVQMIHCLSNVEDGGDSLFVDGFHVANYMRETYPELFEVLSTTPINYCDVGKHLYQFDKMTKHLLFGLDENGELRKLVFSNGRRDSRMTAPLEKVQPLYEAMKTFNQLIHDKKNATKIKLEPGEIMSWNNHRYMHGRVGFELTDDGAVRHLETGYVDWDELRSRRRVIGKQLGLKI